MNMPRSILAAVDPEMRPSASTRRAIELSRRTGARLHLCMPVYDARIDATAERVDPEVARLAREQFIGTRLRWLAEWTAELAAQNLRASCEVVWARAPHEALLVRVLEQAPDLVVKDLEHDSFLGRWPVIQTSIWRLLRTCPSPLMLVQPDAPLMPSRLAAAVDPSHPNARSSGLDDCVVKTALPLAMVTNATLDLVHVFPFRREDAGMSAKLDAVVDEVRAEDRRIYNEFAERHSVPRDRRVLLGGSPAVEILGHVQAHSIDLLVLGSEYRGAWDRFLLGSTAESLIAQATCDLLLVRPEGFAAQLSRHMDLDVLRARHESHAVPG